MATAASILTKVQNALTNYGENVTWLSRVAAYDHETLSTNEVLSTYTFKAAVQDLAKTYKGDSTQLTASYLLHFSPSGLVFTPLVGDRVTVRGIEYVVVSLKDFKFAGVGVLYEVTVGV